jgi:hypothetical protein
MHIYARVKMEIQMRRVKIVVIAITLGLILESFSLFPFFRQVSLYQAYATMFYYDSCFSTVISDEHGGAFVIINDSETNAHFIQHLDSSGKFTWEGSGPVLPDFISSDGITYDDQGGLVYCWEGYINGIEGIYAQRIDSAGNQTWEESGALVQKRKGRTWSVGHLAVTPDKYGGAIIVWQINEDPYPIYAQRIDNEGKIVWDFEGINITPYSYEYPRINCTSDGMGGINIIWRGLVENEPMTFAQRLDNDGNLVWGQNGVQIGSSYPSINFLSDSMLSDKQGGIFVVFNNYTDISVWRLNSSGKIMWGKDNTTRLDKIGEAYTVKLLSDNTDGMFIVWIGVSHGFNFLRDDWDIYAHHIDGSGHWSWKTNKLAICTANSNQMDPQIIPDDFGGFILSWLDLRNDSSHIFAQRVGASGNSMWAKNGVNLRRQYRPIRDYKMVPNVLGGAILLKQEGDSLNPKIISQVVDMNGNTKEPETSLYPPGLPRDKQDYDALLASTTTYYPPQKPIWIWLLVAGSIIIAITLFIIIGPLHNNKNDNRLR